MHGAEVKAIRERLGASHTVLATVLGVARSNIQRWETRASTASARRCSCCCATGRNSGLGFSATGNADPTRDPRSIKSHIGRSES